jgi:hypothetical protein
MASTIIALSGFKGSGKDTVGQFLQELGGFQPCSFAAPLKGVLCEMFGWEPDLMEGVSSLSRLWRETPDPYWSQCLGHSVTPRAMMQTVGTDWVRNHLHQDFWTWRMKQILDRIPGPVVVTDARFPNELTMLQDLGGHLVWVRRDPLPDHYLLSMRFNRWPSWRQKLALRLGHAVGQVHESERAWVGHDFHTVLHNNLNLSELKLQVAQLLTKLG